MMIQRIHWLCELQIMPPTMSGSSSELGKWHEERAEAMLELDCVTLGSFFCQLDRAEFMDCQKNTTMHRLEST